MSPRGIRGVTRLGEKWRTQLKSLPSYRTRHHLWITTKIGRRNADASAPEHTPTKHARHSQKHAKTDQLPKITTMEPLAACLAILTIWFTICKAFNNWEEHK